MANLWKVLAKPFQRSMSVDQWAQQYFNYMGLSYGLGGMPNTSLGGKQEEPYGDFAGFVQGCYRSNGIVFACMMARYLLFSEARFQFRELRSGRPGQLFGSPDLDVLEHPWPGGTTGDLLRQMLLDVDLAGNSFSARRRLGPDNDRIKRMRPDWTTIILGSERDPEIDSLDVDAEVVGYLYHPGGRNSGRPAQGFLREEVAHFAPYPDPLASYRGMSWLTPIIREIMGDAAATSHKLSFFEHGATPNMVVSLSPDIKPDQFKTWIELFEEEHEGALSAYKTLYFGGGATIESVGANMRQTAFKEVQGAGETRIAAAAGIPPIIVGLSEGLEAATYSNYGQARRRFADGTVRPLWRDAAGSLETIVPPPRRGTQLWYDDRDIPFLQEDVADAATVQQLEATSTKLLVDAGFEPQSVVEAIVAGDMKRLRHTGLYSVQLQPPGTVLGSKNGNGNGNSNGNGLPTPEQTNAVLHAQLLARAQARLGLPPGGEE